jgi:aspartate racemase
VHNILAEYQSKCQPRFDQDYPEMVLYNLPIPDPATGIADKRILLASLGAGLRKLEQFPVDFLTVPCNTVHVLIDEMRQEVSIPVLSIIEETSKQAAGLGIEKVGLLATGVTVEHQLYQRGLASSGIQTLLPADQARVDAVIRNIVGGQRLDADKVYLCSEIENFKKQGINNVILGCTDLPVLITQSDGESLGVRLIDSLKVYAAAAVNYCIIT